MSLERQDDSRPATRKSEELQLLLKRVELSAGPIGRMINIISAIAGLIAFMVVASVVTLPLLGKQIPDVLANWGGIILGFYFGQFVNLVKDYMGILRDASDMNRSEVPKQ